MWIIFLFICLSDYVLLCWCMVIKISMNLQLKKPSLKLWSFNFYVLFIILTCFCILMAFCFHHWPWWWPLCSPWVYHTSTVSAIPRWTCCKPHEPPADTHTERHIQTCRMHVKIDPQQQLFTHRFIIHVLRYYRTMTHIHRLHLTAQKAPKQIKKDPCVTWQRALLCLHVRDGGWEETEPRGELQYFTSAYSLQLQGRQHGGRLKIQ